MNDADLAAARILEPKKIVNICSVMSELGRASIAPYTASKGAVMAFSRSLALSLAPEVRVNCLAPGWIRTAWGEGASGAWQERVLRETPLGRWGHADDVAAQAGPNRGSECASPPSTVIT